MTESTQSMADNENTRTIPVLFHRFGLAAAIVVVETALPDHDAAHRAIRAAVNEWALNTHEMGDAGSRLSIEDLILNHDFIQSDELTQCLQRAGVVVRYASRTASMNRYDYHANLLTEDAKNALDARKMAAEGQSG